MDTFGIFTISICVTDMDSRVRRVRLFAVQCARAECEDIYTQFLHWNTHLNKSELVAVFAPETIHII